MTEGLLCIGISLIGIILFLLIPFFKKRKCSKVVEAEIIDIVDGTLVVNGKRMCSAKIKYMYEDVEYESIADLNVEKYKIIVGNKIKTRINPSNPEETYIIGKYTKLLTLVAVVCCVPFILVGVYMISTNIDTDKIKSEVENGDKKPSEGNTSANNNLKDNNKTNEQVSTYDGINDVIKYDKNTTIKLRTSHNYIKIYGILQTEAKYNNFGSNMSNEVIQGNVEYMKSSKLHKNIKGIMFYLPSKFEFREQIGNDYYYVESETESRMRIYFAPIKNNDVYTKALLNDMSNYNRIFKEKVNTVVYNNNEFKVFKARNANGEYLDVVCSLNKNHMLYIEYNHKIVQPNIINEFVTTVKY